MVFVDCVDKLHLVPTGVVCAWVLRAFSLSFFITVSFSPWLSISPFLCPCSLLLLRSTKREKNNTETDILGIYDIRAKGIKVKSVRKYSTGLKPPFHLFRSWGCWRLVQIEVCLGARSQRVASPLHDRHRVRRGELQLNLVSGKRIGHHATFKSL